MTRSARQGRSVAQDRDLTFTEQARREQILRCAVELVAEVGSANASLARIAERAGISKAAVLYHFASKDQVMQLALQSVLDSLVRSVGDDVDSVGSPWEQLSVYIRSLVTYVKTHPAHLRFLVDAISTQELAANGRIGDRAERWRPVAEMLAAGQRAGDFRAFDTRAVAVWIGGAIDGLFNEWLVDRRFDLDAGVQELITCIELAIVSPGVSTM